MKWLLLVVSVLLCMGSPAQKPETYTVKAGVSVWEVIPAKEIYQHPDFTTGTVVFRDGTSATAKLNYNALTAEVQFIDGKGDTLAIANERTVKHVSFSNDTFYYSEGWLRSVTENASVKMGEKVFFKEFVQKPGAYGMSSATTASNNLTTLINKRSVELNTSQELVLIKNTFYLFGNKYNEFQFADKRNVLKMFSHQKKAIEEYLANNNVNFSKEQDVRKLTDFIKGLNP